MLALERANQIRSARAAVKRRVCAGEIALADLILRSSREIDTMTVAGLLRSQRGWGPARATKVLRALSLPDTKTVGSLTERQRTTLVEVLSRGEQT